MSERWDGPIPPGHGEEGHVPIQHRCPICATIIDTYSHRHGEARREGYCPTHGAVAPVHGDRDAILARSGYRHDDP